MKRKGNYKRRFGIQLWIDGPVDVHTRDQTNVVQLFYSSWAPPYPLLCPLPYHMALH